MIREQHSTCSRMAFNTDPLLEFPLTAGREMSLNQGDTWKALHFLMSLPLPPIPEGRLSPPSLLNSTVSEAGGFLTISPLCL